MMTLRLGHFIHCAKLYCASLLIGAACIGAPNANAMDAAASAKEADSLVDQGDEDLENYQFKDAFAAYSSAIDSNYLDNERLAYALWRRGNTREEMLFLEPMEDAALSDQTHILRLQDFSRARALEPVIVDILLSEADALRKLGAYTEAQQTLEDAVAIDLPIPSWSWIRLGELYRELGDYDMSLHYFDLMLSRWTEEWGMPPHYHKAWTLYRLGQYQRSVESLTSGLLQQPDYIGALTLRGCSHVRLGNLSDAKADYDAAVEAIDALPARESEVRNNNEYFQRVAMERQAVEAFQQSSDSPIPREEFCRSDDYPGGEPRERSPLLTDAILAPITASDSTARERAVTAISENTDPQLIAMCELVPCREISRANSFELPNGETTLLPTERFPYVDPRAM